MIDGPQLEAMGVPARIVRALATDSFVETECVTVVRAFQATRAGVLVLSGSVGCGKSVAAAWGLQHNTRTEVLRCVGIDPVERVVHGSGQWVAASSLVEASDFSDAFWRPLRKVQLLVIDEAGAERLDARGRALGNFTELLRRRYDDSRRTIVTSNLPPARWVETYCAGDGGRLRDRLAEAELDFGRSPVVAVTGPSMRRTGGPG